MGCEDEYVMILHCLFDLYFAVTDLIVDFNWECLSVSSISASLSFMALLFLLLVLCKLPAELPSIIYQK